MNGVTLWDGTARVKDLRRYSTALTAMLRVMFQRMAKATEKRVSSAYLLAKVKNVVLSSTLRVNGESILFLSNFFCLYFDSRSKTPDEIIFLSFLHVIVWLIKFSQYLDQAEMSANQRMFSFSVEYDSISDHNRVHRSVEFLRIQEIVWCYLILYSVPGHNY